MPLTSKGQKILSSMRSTYGSDKKAKSVFYASINKGKLKGVERRAEGGRTKPLFKFAEGGNVPLPRRRPLVIRGPQDEEDEISARQYKPIPSFDAHIRRMPHRGGPPDLNIRGRAGEPLGNRAPMMGGERKEIHLAEGGEVDPLVEERLSDPIFAGKERPEGLVPHESEATHVWQGDKRGREGVLNFLGDVTGINDARKILSGRATEDEQKDIALQSGLGMLPFGKAVPLGGKLAALFLVPKKAWAPPPGLGAGENPFRNFAITNEHGKEIAPLNINYNKNKGHIYVEWIGGGKLNPNDLGPTEIRSLFSALKKEFPDAKTIGGFRVSGARTHGQEDSSGANAVMKLPWARADGGGVEMERGQPSGPMGGPAPSASPAPVAPIRGPAAPVAATPVQAPIQTPAAQVPAGAQAHNPYAGLAQGAQGNPLQAAFAPAQGFLKNPLQAMMSPITNPVQTALAPAQAFMKNPVQAALDPLGLMGGFGSSQSTTVTGPQNVPKVGERGERSYRMKRRRAVGGGIGRLQDPSFLAKGAARGLLRTPTPGRIDKLPISVGSGGYVIPADTVSHLGQNNTLAGARVLDNLLKKGMGVNLGSKGGFKKQRSMFAAGGATEGVSIVAAGGEYVVEPERVAALGDGDADIGHKILDDFVLSVRKNHIKTLRNLPKPKK